ncbi:MAG: hypothetical protein DME76_19415, partial [Verrucomicrobia bacterium]
PVLSDACEQIPEIGSESGAVFAIDVSASEASTRKHECAHALMLCRQIKFSKRWKICVHRDGERTPLPGQLRVNGRQGCVRSRDSRCPIDPQ